MNLDMFVLMSGFQNPLSCTHFNMFVDEWTNANESHVMCHFSYVRRNFSVVEKPFRCPLVLWWECEVAVKIITLTSRSMTTKILLLDKSIFILLVRVESGLVDFHSGNFTLRVPGRQVEVNSYVRRDILRFQNTQLKATYRWSRKGKGLESV